MDNVPFIVAVPAPLNLVTEPVSVFLKCVGIDVKGTLKPPGFSSTDDTEEDEQLHKLLNGMIERHKDKVEAARVVSASTL